MTRTDRATPDPHPPGVPRRAGQSTEARPDRQMGERHGLTTGQRSESKRQARKKRRQRDREAE